MPGTVNPFTIKEVTAKWRSATLDDTYQAYLKRVARMALPDAHATQFQHIQESPKFLPQPDGHRKPAPFPGYSLMTPPWQDDRLNDAFYQEIEATQQKLHQQLEPNLLLPLPPESFHFTVADLIWHSAYRDAAEDPEFEVKLRDRMAETFAQCQGSLASPIPIRWQLLGLIVMTRAIAVCLVPKDEPSYDRLVQLRRAIYQNPQIVSLGIEQQYHLTAHVTLGYFGEIPPDLDRDRMSQVISDLNQEWIDTNTEMQVRRVELRKFEDMTYYDRQSDWPVFEFS